MNQWFKSGVGSLACIAFAVILIFTVGPQFDYRLSPQWLFRSSQPSPELIEFRTHSRIGRWLSQEIAGRLQEGKDVATDEDWSNVIDFLNLTGVDDVPVALPVNKEAGWQFHPCHARSANLPELLVLSWKGDGGELFFTLDGRVHYGDNRLMQAASIGKWVSSDGILFANEEALKDWKKTHYVPLTKNEKIRYVYDHTPFGVQCQISTPDGAIMETVDIVEGSGAVAVSRKPHDWQDIWRESSHND